MSDTNSSSGSCLCGAVRFTAKNMSNSIGACHCNMCRNWGGGPFLVIDCGTEVSFESEEDVSVFESSKWAERGFCRRCGSHLYYRLKESNEFHMPVGLFEDDQERVFDHQVFIDEKPSFYSFANKTRDLTGAELFAKYGPPSE